MKSHRVKSTALEYCAIEPSFVPYAQDEVVVRLACYEPNSHQLELTGEDLCRNTLLVGTVGSGKTTTMNPMLRDLIRYRATEPDRKVGLLVIDSKMDETVAKISHWAKEAGRSEDLQVLSPASAFYYDFLKDVRSFEDLDEAVEKICSAAPFSGGDNEYWAQGRKPLLDAALTILLVTSETLEFSEVMAFLNGWLMNPGAPDHVVARRLAQFDQIVRSVKDDLDVSAQNKIQLALSTLRMWSGLDPRTKSNWTSIFTNCLSPMLGVQAQSYFLKRQRRPLALDQIVSEGKIVVLSINAARDPALAQLVGRLIKADFYRAAQSRTLAFSDSGRLVGLVMDEYPLVVTGADGRFGDITQLQSLRSKRAFVVAATQGLVSVDMVIGERARNGLLINFNNLFLLNSHEAQVDAFAKTHFGVGPRSVQASVELEQNVPDGEVATERRRQRVRARFEDWVCPPGRLGQLAPNQAFVSLARGNRHIEPVWIVPLYFDSESDKGTLDQPPACSAMKTIREARQALEAVIAPAFDKTESESPWDWDAPPNEPLEKALKKLEEQGPPWDLDATPNEPAQSEKAVEISPIPPTSWPLAVSVSSNELSELNRKKGLLTQYRENAPNHAEHLFISASNPTTAEHQIELSLQGVRALIRLRARSVVEKQLQRILRHHLDKPNHSSTQTNP